MIATLAALAGLVIGFVGGLCAYRSSRRWCGGCGGSLTCRACTDPAGLAARLGGADQFRSADSRRTRRPETGQAGA